MNRILKIITASVVCVVLAGPVQASTGVAAWGGAAVQKITYTTTGPMPGFSYILPALAQNEIDTLVINVKSVIHPYLGASSVPTVLVSNAYDGAVAGDSTNFSMDIGASADGPWLAVVSLANAYSTTASLPVRSNIQAHTSIPVSPYWRLRIKSKGTAALSGTRRYYVYFPVVGHVWK